MPAFITILCVGGLCLLFAGIGTFLIYKGLQARKKAEASQGWPATTGQITQAQVSRSTHTDSDGDTSTSYTPHVEYSYRVAEQEFTGKNITFGLTQSFSQPAKAQAVLARYPVGSQVSVYYDPNQPGDAVLERKAGGFTASLAIGAIFLLLGVCLGIPGLVLAISNAVQPR
ncbi:MAG: DUF3592 domain-containing protein [Anaerolineales bacterium]|nr:DUF3592 domain-containing protein [Anaerolineales bacterium]